MGIIFSVFLAVIGWMLTIAVAAASLA